MTTPTQITDMYREIHDLMQEQSEAYPAKPEPGRSRLIKLMDDMAQQHIVTAQTQRLRQPDEAVVQMLERVADQPIFIVGYFKSGTTMLRGLLDTHPELIVIPSESRHFHNYTYLSGLSPHLQSAILATKWIQKLIIATNQPPFWLLGGDPTKTSDEDEPDYYERFAQYLYWVGTEFPQQKPLSNVVFALAGVYHDKGLIDPSKITAWIEKTPTTEYMLQDVLQAYPKARFIHIVRDPRSTISSMQKMNQQRDKSFDVTATCHQIARSLQVALQHREAQDEAYHIIRYEDIVTTPEQSMRALAKFMNVDYHESLLGSTQAGTSMTANSGWSENRIEGKIHQKSLDHWQETLSEQTLQQIGRIIGHPAKQFGYDIEEPAGRTFRRQLQQHIPQRVTDALRVLIRTSQD